MKLLYFKFVIFLHMNRVLSSGKNYREKFNNFCGQQKELGRIIGGTEATLGEFPWYARIGFIGKRRRSPEYFCGGSLITDLHVLTAEHCFYTFSRNGQLDALIVSFGDHNSRGSKVCFGQQCSVPVIYAVKKVIPYHLDETTFKHDIAILLLMKKVEFTNFISPICLPDSTPSSSQIGELAIVAGFGYIDSYSRKVPKILQKVWVAIKRPEDCLILSEEPLGPGQICAGHYERDSCDGDSGGPLFKLIKLQSGESRYTQIGIVSYGSMKCEDIHPAVYSDVNYYLKWIDNHLNK